MCGKAGIVRVPAHRKSCAWPDRAEHSSWRWRPCPLQTLPAESGSADESSTVRLVKLSAHFCLLIRTAGANSGFYLETLNDLHEPQS